MTIATIILSLIGVATCIVGIIREHPPLQSLGVFFTMISLALAIVSRL